MDHRRLLEVARAGTEQFQRALDALTDDELAEASLLDGWTRRHVVAHVAYNARALSRLATWANTGIETPMYASIEARNAEIDEGVLLPADELRALSRAAADDLDRAWRETPDDAWSRTVRTFQGVEVPLSTTVWMRTREVWLHAVDLRGVARVTDIPDDVLRKLLANVVSEWRRRDESFDAHIIVQDGSGDDGAVVVDERFGAGGRRVAGPLPAVVEWATGRGTSGLEAGSDVRAPRWL